MVAKHFMQYQVACIYRFEFLRLCLRNFHV